ncbi:hypothetical protein [Nitrobacter sp. TKz-YC01]
MSHPLELWDRIGELRAMISVLMHVGLFGIARAAGGTDRTGMLLAI